MPSVISVSRGQADARTLGPRATSVASAAVRWGRKGSKRTSLSIGASVGAVLWLAWSGAAQAGSYTVDHSFDGGTNGAFPTGIVVDTAGNQYGAAYHGGVNCQPPYSSLGCGLIYKIDAQGRYSVLATFDGTNGTAGFWQLSLYDKVLYGTGGAPGDGVSDNGSFGDVYSLKTDGSAFQILHVFSGTDGSDPEGRIAADDAGNIFGVTLQGGPGFDGVHDERYGVIYEIQADGTFKVLYDFTDGTDGENPNSLVTDKQGNLFGTDQSNSGAQIFEYEIATGSLKILTIFDDRTEKGYPTLTAVDSDGNLYGTDSATHKAPDGSIFELHPNAGGYRFTILHAFTGQDEGSFPYGLTLDGHHNLIGITFYGPSFTDAGGQLEPGYGTLFSYSQSTSQLTTLYDFTAPTSTADRPSNNTDSIVNPAASQAGTIFSTILRGGDCPKEKKGCGAAFTFAP